MRRRVPLCVTATALLTALVGGCSGSGSGDGEDRGAQPKVTETRTVTKEPPGTSPQKKAPPENPVPRGPADVCARTGSTPDLRTGSSGAAVTQAQCYLNLTLTGSKIPEDGQFGPVTDSAVRRFQGCAGITVDGYVGPETWTYLIYWASASSYLC